MPGGDKRTAKGRDFVGLVLRPLRKGGAPVATAMDHAQDLDPIRSDAVGDDKRQSRDDELARTRNSSLSPQPWMNAESRRGLVQTGRDFRSGAWISRGDILHDLAEIGEGSREPEDLHSIRR